MYRGYNLDLPWGEKLEENFYLEGQKLYQKYESLVQAKLKNFTLDEGCLNGSDLQSNWFPEIEADIFISHSHDDKKNVIALAGILYKVFGIRSFIDSCIWGYSNNLLKIIDDKHCLHENGLAYNYNKRNYSTSHVHMMLSTALSMMMDKTECLFFVNTPNSISTTEIVNKTSSPWLYSEIATSRLLRVKRPTRIIEETRNFQKGITNERLEIQYDVDLTHLTKITNKTLLNWIEAKKTYNFKTATQALDALYSLTTPQNL